MKINNLKVRLSLLALSASVLMNVAVACEWFYLIDHPNNLIQLELTHVCKAGIYKKWINTFKNPDPAYSLSERRYAAASACFVDYATGKSIDLDSVHPHPDSKPVLPAGD